MTSLLKRNGYYYFRMRIPRDLLHIMKTKEIVKSLHTKTYKDAKILITSCRFRLEKLFTLVPKFPVKCNDEMGITP